jgi:hypothetical protein
LAHPGSGIALDRQGNVFFVDTGHGVWRLDSKGHLSDWGRPAFHWMALDLDDRFGATRLPYSANAEMRVTGKEPRVVVSSDYPVVIGADGALYYADPDAAHRCRSCDSSRAAAVASGPACRRSPRAATCAG